MLPLVKYLTKVFFGPIKAILVAEISSLVKEITRLSSPEVFQNGLYINSGIYEKLQIK